MTKLSNNPPVKIKNGTLVAIPIGNNKFALSQVYYAGVVFYLIVYDGLYELNVLSVSRSNKIILASWTNDAEIYRGRWIIVGDAPLEFLVPEPHYKVLIGGSEMVESFDGKIRRAATVRDKLLHNRKSRSPLILEDAVRAFHGLGKWSPRYDDMLIGNPTS